MLFGEAVSRGIMGAALAKELYLVVALRWGHLATFCLLYSLLAAAAELTAVLACGSRVHQRLCAA